MLKCFVFIDGSLGVKVPVLGNLWSIFIAKLYCFVVNKRKHFISNINQLFGKTSTPDISKTKKTDVNLNEHHFAFLDSELIPPRTKIITNKMHKFGECPLNKLSLLLLLVILC